VYFVNWFIQNIWTKISVKYLAAIAATAFILVYSYTSINWIIPNSAFGLGFFSQTWQQSQIVEEIGKLPQTTSIYSNAPHAVYIMTGRSAMPLPKQMATMNQQINQEYSQQLEMITTQIHSGQSVVVYFNLLAPESNQTLSDLLLQDTLEIIAQTADGTIYGKRQ
jgi:hypothetical protein